MDEDLDEILEEYDVFMTRNASNKLHILQFPVRSLDDPVSINTIRCRPNNKIFEVEIAIEKSSKNFDKSKSEHIALNADGDAVRDGDKINFPDGHMDKYLLVSNATKSDSLQFAAGMVKNHQNEIHLTPINSVIQFRPTFKYFNKSVIRIKSSRGNVYEEAESSQDESEPMEDVKTITMRFAGPNDDRIKRAREKSYNFLQQQVATEQWINVTYNPEDSQESEKERFYMQHNPATESFSTAESDNLISFNDYLKSFKDLNQETIVKSETVEKPLPSHLTPVPLSKIRTMSMADQIRAFLLNAKALSFEQLVNLISDPSDPVSALRIVQQYAYLVQGNWVVKSELLYNKELVPISPITGIPSEILWHARDYIIWSFTQSNSLNRMELQNTVRVPQEDILAVLNEVGRYNAENKTWSFKLPNDYSFLERYPEVAQRQSLLWTNRHAQLARIYSTFSKVEEDHSTNSMPAKIIPKRRRKSRKDSEAATCSGTDENESSTESMITDQVENTHIKIKRECVSPSKSTSSRRLSSNFQVANGLNDFRKSKVSRIATFEVSPTHLDVCPSFEDKKELVRCVQEKLKNCFCAPFTEIRSAVYESVNGKILCSLNDDIIQNAILEAGGFKVQNQWPQQTIPQVLFAFTKFGDQYDNIRETLFEIFAVQTRLRIGHLKERVQSKYGEIWNKFGEKNCDNLCKKILKDYCVMKSGMHYLKGTVN